MAHLRTARLAKRRATRLADYGERFLLRFLAIVLVIGLISIPLVRWFMEHYEGRPITLGEAAVFVVQSLTTTGYGELLPFQSAQMKIVSVTLMLSGVVMVFMIGGTLVTMMVERRVARRAPRLTRLTDHVIFIGFNETVELGIDLLKMHDVPYVVATNDPSRALDLIDRGIECVVVDAERDEGLERLNVRLARLVVTAGDDPMNINVTLAVLTLSETPVIAIMGTKHAAELALDAGASRAITPHETLGLHLVDWVLSDPSPTQFLDLVDVEVSPPVLQQLCPSIIHVAAHHPLSGQTIGDSRLRTHTGATIVAIWTSQGAIYRPEVNTVIGSESTLIVLGSRKSVDRLATYLGGPEPGARVILVGAGKVGQQAGRRLNECGIRPVVIDLHQVELSFDGDLVIGDASDRHVLEKVRIEEADTLMVTTNRDSRNMFVVLKARKMNPRLNIVARAERAETAERLRRAGADHVLSESILGSELLQMGLVHLGVLPKLSDYVVKEVPCPVDNRTLGTATELYNGSLFIICVVRDGRVVEPDTDFVLQRTDRLVVLGSPRRIAEVIGGSTAGGEHLEAANR